MILKRRIVPTGEPDNTERVPSGSVGGWGKRSVSYLARSLPNLTLLRTLPETPERVQQELDVQLALGSTLSITQGYATPEIEQTYNRVQILCQQIGETPQLCRALYGLCAFYFHRGALRLSREVGEQLVRLAPLTGEPRLRLEAYTQLGFTLGYLGDYATAHTHFAQGLGTVVRGWVLVAQGQDAAGLQCMQQGLAAVEAAGPALGGVRVYCLFLLAEAMGRARQVTEGLRLLAQVRTILETNGRGNLLAEVYRLQGELVAQGCVALSGAQLPDAQAEAYFQDALAIARQQHAKSWELRVALSLSRLWQRQGKHTEARDLLAPVYGWFTEGFDTADLQDAKALLEELTG